MKEINKIARFLLQEHLQINPSIADQIIEDYQTRLHSKPLTEKVFYLAIVAPLNPAIVSAIFDISHNQAKEVLYRLESLGCLQNIGSQWWAIKAVDIVEILASKEPEESRFNSLVQWKFVKGKWLRKHPQYAIKQAA